MVTVIDASDSVKPIFVVGAPRSGTTLLAALLAAHSRLSCGPETGFFDRLDGINPDTLADSRTWPDGAVDYLYSVVHLGKAIPDNYGIPRAHLVQDLRVRHPSVPAILASVTEQFMRQVGKKRWVEKTPSHCLSIRHLRRFFPTAPVLHIVRDPRDVALSLQKEWWGHSSLIDSIWQWRAYEEIGGEFLRKDRNALTLRYEDLLLATEAKLREVCDFIGETYEPGMQDTSRSIQHVNRTDERCKIKAGMPIDPTRVANWQKSLSDEENRVFEAVLGNYLRAHGYPCRDDFKGYARIYPRGQSRHYWPALGEFVAQGYRFWAKHPREVAAVSVYLDQPDSNGWLPGGSAARLLGAAAISLGLLRAKVRRRPVYWFETTKECKTSGFCAGLLRLSLKACSSSASRLGPRLPVCANGGSTFGQ
jgi:hypothetical protein